MHSNETPAAAPRNLWGWFGLVLLFTLMTATQLSGYLHRGKPGEKAPMPSLSNIELSYRLRLMQESLGGKSEPSNEALTRLDPFKTEDEGAAELYAIIAFQQGKTIPDAVLGRLRSSQSPVYRSVAEIYGAKSFTRSEGDRLESRLPKGIFRYNLARHHIRFKVDPSVSKAYKVGAQEQLRLGALTLFAALILGLGFVLLLAYVGARAQGHLEPLGHPALPASDDETDQLAMKAAQLFAAFLIGSEVIAGLLASPKEGIMPLRSFILGCVIIGLTVLCIKIKPLFPLWRLGWHKERLLTNILWGVGGAIANTPLILVSALAGAKIFEKLPSAEHPVETFLLGQTSPIVLLVLLFQASVQAPIFEETLFRGTLLPALSSVTKRAWVGIVLSSVLFAAIHPTGIPAWPPLAMIGAMSCCLAYQTKSLVPSMVMHAVHNAATLCIIVLIR